MARNYGGYDAPARDDLLGRWSFAREIALVATNAPADWSLRVGVYGSWGTGKTSVLGFVDQIVTDLGHVCVWFNPWGHGEKDEMFGDLADVAKDALDQAGIKTKGWFGRTVRKAGSAVAGGAETVADVALAAGAPEVTASVAKRYLPRLRRFMKDRATDFLAIQEALGNRRLVVLIDDVDRIDPKLLPNLLFALHEVLALPGFSYVLALDPVVVDRALRSYHEGFEDGLSFLEKIVQFPRWIPEPSREALWKVAERDARNYAPEFIDAIRQEFTFLPTNPRALRSLIRNLWSLRAELDRHNADEIDWNLLVLISLLRTLCPAVVRNLLRDEKLMDGIGAPVMFRNKEKRLKELQDGLDALIDRSECRNSEQVRAVLFSMLGRTFMWTTDRIRYHGFLADRPHAVTWKEFDAVWTHFPDAGIAPYLDRFVLEHAKRRSEMASRVVDELVTRCLSKHHSLVEAASESGTDDLLRAQTDGARRTVAMLGALCFEIGEERRAGLDDALLRRLLGAFMQWAHFTNHEDYRLLRAEERELTLRVAEDTSAPADLLEVMEPWNPHSERTKDEANEFAALLCDRLRPRLASGLVQAFGRASGIVGLLREPKIARRYILFRPGEAWTPASREQLRRIVEHGGDVVADNCQAFFQLMVDGERASRLWINPGELGELAKDKDLVRLVWHGATSVRVNPRFFSRLKTIRHEVEKVAGSLPEPAWWAEAQANYGETATSDE